MLCVYVCLFLNCMGDEQTLSVSASVCLSLSLPVPHTKSVKKKLLPGSAEHAGLGLFPRILGFLGISFSNLSSVTRNDNKIMNI